jgi:hypothetical protein
VEFFFANGSDEKRRVQYYTFGCRYLQCIKATLGKDDLDFVLRGIDGQSEDSFLGVCITGWSARLLNLKKVSGVGGRRQDLSDPFCWRKKFVGISLRNVLLTGQMELWMFIG